VTPAQEAIERVRALADVLSKADNMSQWTSRASREHAADLRLLLSAACEPGETKVSDAARSRIKDIINDHVAACLEVHGCYTVPRHPGPVADAIIDAIAAFGGGDCG
jgi:hypothetical protein